MKTVVVTGVSTGIGWATAKVLLVAGLRVFGSVRRQEDAARVAAGLGPGFTPLRFDVTDGAAVHAAAAQVEATLAGEALFGLVNNAGIAVPGPLLHLEIEDFRHQLDVNLTGQLVVTQSFAPLLGGDPPGRIVMISSVSGRIAAPFVGPYVASKFGLEGLSDSLRRELMVFGIDVIVIAPGTVATPIWDKADAIDVGRYARTPYAPALAKLKQRVVAEGRRGLPPEAIGRAVLKALTLAHPRPRYTVTPDPLVHVALRLLPTRLADRLYARTLGLERTR